MEDFKMLEVWATARTAAQSILDRLWIGEWTLEVDTLGNYWIHPNPHGAQEQGSTYGGTFQEVVQNAAKSRGQAAGYDWAFT